MYCFFDKNGILKEIVNDEALRKGSLNYNKIYVYIDGGIHFDDIYGITESDGTLSNEVSFKNNTTISQIPYDKKRDLKYFKDFKTYEFYEYTIPSIILNKNSLAKTTIRITIGNSIYAYGMVTYNVENNVIKIDHEITQSQYDYLISLMGSKATREDLTLFEERLNRQIQEFGQNLIHLVDDRIEYNIDRIVEVSNAPTTGKVWMKEEATEDINIYTKEEVDNLIDGLDALIPEEEQIIDSASTIELRDFENPSYQKLIVYVKKINTLDSIFIHMPQVDVLSVTSTFADLTGRYEYIPGSNTLRLDLNSIIFNGGILEIEWIWTQTNLPRICKVHFIGNLVKGD